MANTAANSDVNSNAGDHGNHLLLDTSPGIILEEPNLAQMRMDRQDRTRATMKAVDPHLTAKVLPKVDNSGPEDRAATRIQAGYRGHLGRKKYLDLLYAQFEKEETMRLEKTRAQCEQGELLVENHRLQVQLDDDNTTRRNRSRQYNTHVITIQRAWRSYKRTRPRDPGTPNNNMSPQLSETDELSDTESANGAQAMSVSTPDDTSDKNLNPEDDIQSDFDSTANPDTEEELVDRGVETQSRQNGRPGEGPPGGRWIEPEADSVVSDYSEMADPLKEHLANVQIVAQDDLQDTGGPTMFHSPFSVSTKIMRSPDETEEEFTRRLRKINYLSLAQEFAALKKIDADALPFDLLRDKSGGGGGQDYSPMSEASSETDLTDSSATTPMESAVGDGGDAGADPPANIMTKLTERFERAINPVKNAWGDINDTNDNDSTNGALPSSAAGDSSSSVEEAMPIQRQLAEVKIMSPPDVIPDDDTCDEPDMVSETLTAPRRADERKSVSPGGGVGNDKLGDFDVYNIESTLPQLDWSMLEEQLHRAAEEERQKQRSRRNDREEIRRKLAMGGEEEYYGGERAYRKPNLQTRLQSGMNLQICFMNEATSDVDSVNGDDVKMQNAAALVNAKGSEAEIIPTKPPNSGAQDGKEKSVRPAGDIRVPGSRGKEDDDDFFSKQAKLQDEARMALAQVRPMAHMQLEVEKQMRKKSPIAEMVGIPALAARKKLGRYLLSDMNVAQLQVVVNDLHSQIETLNEELVMMLVGRDDLHMEQDSMLVDIEDHHRRALEVAAKMNKPKRPNKKK